MKLSPVQYGTLSHFRTHNVTIKQLRYINNVTIRALLRRGYLRRSGNTVHLTQAGADAYNEYRHSSVPMRKVEGPLSPQVEELLHNARMTVFSVIRGDVRKSA